MNKLQQLIEAAKAATPGPWETRGLDKAGQAIVGNKDIELFTCWHHSVGSIEKEMRSNAKFIALANPGTSLELCALLEKCEEALKQSVIVRERLIRWRRNSWPTTDQEAITSDAYPLMDEALAAIKQWKEQT